MVTLLNPKQNKSNNGYEEPASAQTAPVNQSQNGPAEPVAEIAAFAQPATRIKSASKKNVWSGIAKPLTGLWKLLAGPPMTERERRRQALAEAKARSASAQNWFYRAPF